MRRLPLLALSVTALLASPALAQQPAAQDQSITVTGNRLQAYRDRLAACLARHCPVNEDVDATALRHGANANWAAPFVNAIRGRVHAAGPEPTYRIERYVYTAGYERTSGSRMAVRSPYARIEYFDLTNGVSPPAPPPPSADQNGGRPAA